ncbi:macrophage mannose receptor 1-like [Carassius auratus]|uniref:Macrophage mannose receptor 1-like n=1 Tax=Carassius auratus TaxID=7957 RepID=A0A6P6PKH2_CARAU|nr:macrophage mannose receptor 1-like [Carassius auratus]
MRTDFICTLLSGLCISSVISKQFVFVQKAKTFSDAQKYCRSFHGDLASVEDEADFSRLQAVLSGVSDPSVWIGLKRAETDWFWSLSNSTFYGEGEAVFRRWQPGQPDNEGAIENCGVIGNAGTFWDVPCGSLYTFICYDGQDNALQKYVFVNQLKNWSEAQTFCRQKHTDLVSVRNTDEQRLVKVLVPWGTLVFIGLFKDSFRWSDNSRSSFRRWSVDEPNVSGDCVLHQLSDINTWATQNCTETRPFICQDEVKLQVLKVKLKSGQNVNDPVLKASIMKENQQKLWSLGLPKDAKLRWRAQPDGEIFQLLENEKNSCK